jgi:starch synthase
MHAQRYGTVPVVRKTGGLADTVSDYNAKTGRGAGFVFEDYTALALLRCLRRALEVYGNAKAWKVLMRNGMLRDFSWEQSAKEYEKVYRKAMRKK